MWCSGTTKSDIVVVEKIKIKIKVGRQKDTNARWEKTLNPVIRVSFPNATCPLWVWDKSPNQHLLYSLPSQLFSYSVKCSQHLSVRSEIDMSVILKSNCNLKYYASFMSLCYFAFNKLKFSHSKHYLHKLPLLTNLYETTANWIAHDPFPK